MTQPLHAQDSQATRGPEGLRGGGASSCADRAGQAESRAFAAILHVEAGYAAQLQRVRIDASLSSGIRMERKAEAEGAMRALGEVRRLLMMDEPIPEVAAHVQRLAAEVGQ